MKYASLRIVAKILQIVGYVAAILGAIAAIVGVVLLGMKMELPPGLDYPWHLYGAYLVFVGLLTIAFSELLVCMMDIERHLRGNLKRLDIMLGRRDAHSGEKKD